MELSESSSSSSVSPNLDLHIGNSNEIDQVQLNHSDIGSQQSTTTAAYQQLDNPSDSGGDAAVSHSSPDPEVVDHAVVVDEIERLDLRGDDADDVAVEAAAEVEEGGEVEAEEKSSNGGGGGEIENGNESERQSEEEESNEGENRSENGEKKGGEYNRRYQYPVRPEAEDCSFYLKTGNCKFGSNCKFNHPVRRKNNQVFKDKVKEKDEFSEKPSQTECKYYLRPGGCKYGKACRYNHGKGKPSVAPVVELNFLGLPIRQGERECPYYMRNGSCKYGSNCRFNHPDPTAAGGSDPPSGFDNGGPASLQGGLQSSSWSAPRSLNETPLYMPMMMPPSQGVPSQNTEWNGYQAPVYLERSMPARPPYVINNSGTKTNVYKQYPPSNQVDEFPERPGQRLCSFFLRTGDCKFKSNCKYHHPKSQTAVSPSFAPSDKGLPLRPLNFLSKLGRAGRYVRMEEPIGEYCCPVQIIDSDGDFKNAGLDRFIEQAKLGECGASYVVTSIIGAQSSGKSTLMNHLFGTGFTEMDINKRRCQTTKGIWIARCAGIEPCTLAMDVEGTDGRERGEIWLGGSLSGCLQGVLDAGVGGRGLSSVSFFFAGLRSPITEHWTFPEIWLDVPKEVVKYLIGHRRGRRRLLFPPNKTQ